jgi:hypothetical protein
MQKAERTDILCAEREPGFDMNIFLLSYRKESLPDVQF